MTDKTLRLLGELMGAVRPTGSFAARRTGSAENLAIEVDGVGPIGLPVPPAQARQLCEIARPARYGRREQTLLDTNVRNTWEVPLDRVTIDERWRETLLPVLDTVRAELGLAPTCGLSAELHSMLVYEPGQFFRRHQDSEKAEGMIGTLVVTLPSAFTGGELVIEQQGTRVTDQGSPEELSFVAFYSDCEHEVLPVTEGFRITLTYNLVARGRTGPDAAAYATHSSVAPIAEQLREHFSAPVEVPTRYADGRPATRVPRQLVYLLDHQYSQQGFGWDQLKGHDSARAAMMLAAAGEAGYDVSLALAEVEETYDEDYTSWMLIYRERWERVEDGWKCIESSEVEFDDDGEMVEPEHADPAGIPVRDSLPLAPGSDDLGDLRWSNIRLTWLIDRAGAAGEPETRDIRDEELCTGDSNSTLEPFASEIEGYTGNEGNTASFWYRRAAIVVRPRQ
ncbi:2OG-Fe(II) oxygenase [Nocardia carnea]|uniref:2OG-Fe(II) oxygenase n=1 Tax=Nocardia carnea TaxID=37328 RepID=UPI0024576DD1|nr:2OG-Fe(II) oxygenase [Nocardia carnea]